MYSILKGVYKAFVGDGGQGKPKDDIEDEAEFQDAREDFTEVNPQYPYFSSSHKQQDGGKQKYGSGGAAAAQQQDNMSYQNAVGNNPERPIKPQGQGQKPQNQPQGQSHQYNQSQPSNANQMQQKGNGQGQGQNSNSSWQHQKNPTSHGQPQGQGQKPQNQPQNQGSASLQSSSRPTQTSARPTQTSARPKLSQTGGRAVAAEASSQQPNNEADPKNPPKKLGQSSNQNNQLPERQIIEPKASVDSRPLSQTGVLPKFRLEVKFNEDDMRMVDFFEGEDPLAVAIDFCERNKIADLTDALTQYLQAFKEQTVH